MALQSSGSISLNDIHIEAGGSSGTQATINDSDIRGLIGKTSAAQSSFSEFYGASSGYRYWRWYITGRRASNSAGIQVAEWDWMNNGSVISMPTPTNPGGSSPSNEPPSKVVDNSNVTKWLDFNFGGALGNNSGFSILQFDFGSATEIDGYRWYTANDANARDPVSWRIEYSSNGSSWTTAHTITNASITTTRYALAGTWTF